MKRVEDLCLRNLGGLEEPMATNEDELSIEYASPLGTEMRQHLGVVVAKEQQYFLLPNLPNPTHTVWYACTM